ncbi:MAG: ribonuclease HI [Gemmatimonadales bacterium]|nr:ribonuclease HI [Gemmatimonadales bacterium]
MSSRALVHLDESCLGNGQEGLTPGGAGGLVEVRTVRGLVRRDLYLHSPDTTNNKMALAGAIAVLQLLAGKGNRFRVLIVSDSEYLVRGVREWLPAWIGKGWKRKGGAIENLDLWRALHQSLALHDTELSWVRGHNGHPKNEYANDLAVRAAKAQETSAGLVASGWSPWFDRRRAAGQFLDYDPDAAFAGIDERIARGDRFPFDLDASPAPSGD